MTHLITHLKSKDFMGHSIDEDIGHKTIYTGNNTAGKSMRANIIAITALGFSPFSAKTNKKPSDILDDFGDGKKMVTEFTCGGVVFERKFTRSSKGSVSNIVRVNKTISNKSEFAVALSRAGDPRIIDLNAFLKLSDNGKVDTLFKLYPPGADLTNLDSNIEKSKKKIKLLNESIGNNEGAIKKLIESKTAIEMPAGTLADTTAAIENIDKGILETKNSLAIAEEKNAAELKPEVNTQDKSDQMMEENTAPFPQENEQAVKIENRTLENNVNSNSFSGKSTPAILWTSKTVGESIQKIIDTMEKTDCSMCAGLMMAKKVLRKFKGGAK